MPQSIWNESETNKLKELYPYLSNFQISMILHKSINAIQHKANRLKLHKDKDANFEVRSLCRSGINGSNWKGGKKKNRKGHVLILRKGHPMSTKSGYIMEHRLVMAEFLGRILTDNEVVHHINGIKDDNRIENLVLMKRGEHTTLHHKGVKRSKQACENIRKGVKNRYEQSNS